jgi:hypothetical protein
VKLCCHKSALSGVALQTMPFRYELPYSLCLSAHSSIETTLSMTAMSTTCYAVLSPSILVFGSHHGTYCKFTLAAQLLFSVPLSISFPSLFLHLSPSRCPSLIAHRSITSYNLSIVIPSVPHSRSLLPAQTTGKWVLLTAGILLTLSVKCPRGRTRTKMGH